VTAVRPNETSRLRRAWWKKKRWWAAGVVWLAFVTYPAMYGPAMYAYVKGWVPREAVTVFHPVWYANQRLLPWPYWTYFEEYVNWWEDLGHRQEGTVSPRHTLL
jgi:hypothetical protein